MLIISGRGAQNSTTSGENPLSFSHNLKKYINSVPAILLLGIYTREIKTYIHFFHTRNVYNSFIHNIPPQGINNPRKCVNKVQ